MTNAPQVSPQKSLRALLGTMFIAVICAVTFLTCFAPGFTYAQSTEAECRAVNGTWTRSGGRGAAGMTCVRTQATPPGCANVSFLRPGTWVSCAASEVSTLVGSAVIYVFTSFIGISEKFLNVVVTNTVLSGGFSTMYDSIRAPIENGWTFVRDLMNIAIIGIFVFIAISIILGLKEYGEKKLVARVLIVAILINFSFLFTRIIINASNAFSSSIYNNLIVQVLNEGGASSATPMTIGKKYIKDLKVMTFADARETLRNDGNTSGFSKQWMRVLIASSLGIILTIAFLFAALLLLARFLVLIIALCLSAAAFASILLPSTKAMIWDQWWSALWKNALLAPVLFTFLWISLQISSGVGTAIGGNPSAQFGSINGPDAPEGAILLLLNYAIIIGFLFIGIILSKNLSNHLALRITGSAFTAPLGIGTAGLGLVPNFFAYRRMQDTKKKMREVAQSTTLTTDQKARRLAALSKIESKQKTAANRDWNVMNRMPKAVASALGVSGLSAGQTKIPSYAKIVEAQGKKLGHQMEGAEITANDKNVLKRQREEIISEGKKSLENIKKQNELHKEGVKVAKDGVEQERKAAEQNVKEASVKMEKADKHGEDEVKRIEAETEAAKVTAVSGAPTEQIAARTKIKENMALTKKIMDKRMEESESARQDHEKAQARLKAAMTALTSSPEIAKAESLLKDSTAEMNKVQSALDDRVKIIDESIDDHGEALHREIDRRTTNKDFAREAKKFIKDHHENAFFKKLAKATQVADDHAAPSAPVAGAAPAADTHAEKPH